MVEQFERHTIEIIRAARHERSNLVALRAQIHVLISTRRRALRDVVRVAWMLARRERVWHARLVVTEQTTRDDTARSSLFVGFVRESTVTATTVSRTRVEGSVFELAARQQLHRRQVRRHRPVRRDAQTVGHDFRRRDCPTATALALIQCFAHERRALGPLFANVEILWQRRAVCQNHSRRIPRRGIRA